MTTTSVVEVRQRPVRATPNPTALQVVPAVPTRLRDRVAESITATLGRGLTAVLGSLIPPGDRLCEICEDHRDTTAISFHGCGPRITGAGR